MLKPRKRTMQDGREIEVYSILYGAARSASLRIGWATLTSGDSRMRRRGSRFQRLESPSRSRALWLAQAPENRSASTWRRCGAGVRVGMSDKERSSKEPPAAGDPRFLRICTRCGNVRQWVVAVCPDCQNPEFSLPEAAQQQARTLRVRGPVVSCAVGARVYGECADTLR